MRRDDLLALDADKLAALANRGLVKRATKDLAAGRSPTIRVEDDGTVVAEAGDVITRLPPETPLRDTPCSCPATKVCRHRVMAVLAYQRRAGDEERPAAPARWSPARVDDAALRELLGRWAWGRAERRRRRGYVAQVIRDADAPTVELPTCTVRFLVPDALSYARCDCEAAVKCEHLALAVWAFRRADARDPGAPRATVQVGGDRGGASGDAGALDPALELARALLLDGAVGSGAALGARFARAKKPLSEARLTWPVTLCEELEETLEGYAGRGATYRPERVGALLTELYGRALAARRDAEVPARAVLGRDEPTETRLEHLRLIALGARLSAEAREGGVARVRADVHLANPDTGDVLVLRKRWELPADEVGPALARRHVQSGVPLGTLARGQMVTQAAKRRANRQLLLGRGGVGRTSVTPQRGRWDVFGAPLYADDVQSLRRALRERPPSVVRPRLLADRVHVFAVGGVGPARYSAADQTLRAELFDRRGEALRVELEHAMAAPRAVDALALALAGRFGAPRFVSGEVRREGEHLVLTPLSVVADRVVALELEPVEEGAAALPRDALAPPADPIHEALVEARAQLDRGAHQGLRHVGSGWREGLDRAAERLEQVGLRVCADALGALGRRLAGRQGGRPAGEEALARAWLDASLRVRLCLEAG
jgi:hypothetical protein